MDSLINKLSVSNFSERKINPGHDHANDEPKALPPAKAISFPVIGKFIRDELDLSLKSVPVPAQKTYDSAKKRKKAERLNRKHEMQMTGVHSVSNDQESKSLGKNTTVCDGKQDKDSDPFKSSLQTSDKKDAFFHQFISEGFPDELLTVHSSDRPSYIEDALRKIKQKRV